MMAREKRLKPLKSYLRRPAVISPQNADVIDMLKRMAERNPGVVITKIQRPEGVQ